MSLLLDALRRAEEARRAKEADGKDVQAESVGKPATAQRTGALPTRELAIEDADVIKPETAFAIEPFDPPEPTMSADRNLALEELADLIVRPASPPAPVSKIVPSRNVAAVMPPKEMTQRDVARNVFTSKQSTVQSVNGNGKRKWILPVVASVFIILGAGGWYVWNEVNRVSQPMSARNPSQAPFLPRAAPSIGQIATKQVPAAETSLVTTSEVSLAAPLPPLLPPAAAEAPLPKIPQSTKAGTERVLTDRESLANKLRDAPVAKEPPMGLRLARSFEPPKLNPDLTIAYQSLVNGDYTVAQKLYAKLVLAEPLNVDAQLGLATAAARSGDKSLAKQHYRQVLVLDPRNGLAIMGLVALSDGAQPAALEIELKTLIGRNPDAAPLHFALGNIYASERRWTEAQQAFFEAFRIDPVNPDYLFNLAVSLDQLRQTRLALDYYRKAESVAAARGGGQFDRNTVAKRIGELSGETGRSN